MKILIYSPLFYPSIGGLETVVSILAHEFVAQHNEVKIVSQIPATDSKSFPFNVLRKPTPQKLLILTHWCDVYFQPNISLKGMWPLLLIPKPWVIAHNNCYTRSDGSLGWQDYLKHFSIRFSANISVSKAMAAHLSTQSVIIPNPYREEIFYKRSHISPEKDLVFLGRLVYQKGADLLLSALANLKYLGFTPKLTIIGEGEEKYKLRQKIKDLKITNQVDFVGVKVDNELAEILNLHKIMVIPSRYQEGFGVVALEGIACGCVIIGSESGGLAEAIGPCGVTFPNGDVKALSQTLVDFLTNPDKLLTYREKAESHLSRHKKAVIAKAYLQVFERVIQ